MAEVTDIVGDFADELVVETSDETSSNAEIDQIADILLSFTRNEPPINLLPSFSDAFSYLFRTNTEEPIDTEWPVFAAHQDGWKKTPRRSPRFSDQSA